MSTAPVALVTGAARGIGLAAARRFLADGWRVAMLDILDAPLAAAVAALNADDRTLAVAADVSNTTQAQAAAERVRAHFGRLDALVNNAGVATFKPAMETTRAEWQRIMDVNLTGPLLMTQACAPLLGEHGGAIVNITSISGLRASTLRVAYGTSKAALAHLTKQLAVELASAGIRVNAIAPGPVETAMAKAVHTADIRRDYHDAIPLNRYGLEDEIANVIVFLCGPQATYITGQEIAVDGGFNAAGIGLTTLRRDRANR